MSFSCQDCAKYLKCKQALERHRVLVHELWISSTLNCNICEKSFTSRKIYQRHLASRKHFVRKSIMECQSDVGTPLLDENHYGQFLSLSPPEISTVSSFDVTTLPSFEPKTKVQKQSPSVAMKDTEQRLIEMELKLRIAQL